MLLQHQWEDSLRSASGSGPEETLNASGKGFPLPGEAAPGATKLCPTGFRAPPAQTGPTAQLVSQQSSCFFQPFRTLFLRLAGQRRLRQPAARRGRPAEGLCSTCLQVSRRQSSSSKLKQTTLGSVISWRANLIPSRPSPLFFTPPKGIMSRR